MYNSTLKCAMSILVHDVLTSTWLQSAELYSSTQQSLEALAGKLSRKIRFSTVTSCFRSTELRCTGLCCFQQAKFYISPTFHLNYILVDRAVELSGSVLHYSLLQGAFEKRCFEVAWASGEHRQSHFPSWTENDLT